MTLSWVIIKEGSADILVGDVEGWMTTGGEMERRSPC